MVLFQGVGDEQQTVLKAERAGVGNALHQEVPGIVERGELLGERPSGSPIERRGRTAVEELVGSVLVVLGAEGVEGPLLGRQRATRRPDRAGLQGLVHPLVGPVLLGVQQAECVGAESRGASTRC